MGEALNELGQSLLVVGKMCSKHMENMCYLKLNLEPGVASKFGLIFWEGGGF